MNFAALVPENESLGRVMGGGEKRGIPRTYGM